MSSPMSSIQPDTWEDEYRHALTQLFRRCQQVVQSDQYKKDRPQNSMGPDQVLVVVRNMLHSVSVMDADELMFKGPGLIEIARSIMADVAPSVDPALQVLLSKAESSPEIAAVLGRPAQYSFNIH